MSAVDVCIPTDGETPHLMEAIRAIQGCIPVNLVLRADGGSLGEARQRLIEAASTERFMMLDSDVVLEPGPWFDEALHADGCTVFQMPLAVDELERFVSFWRRVRLPLKGTFFGTMATFFSKKSLQGIRIPGELSGAEDIYILLFLRARKVPIRVVRVPGAHYHSPSPKKGRWVGSSLRILQGKVGFRAVLPFVARNILLYPFTMAVASLLSRSPKTMRYGLSLWREYVQGYFG